MEIHQELLPCLQLFDRENYIPSRFHNFSEEWRPKLQKKERKCNITKKIISIHLQNVISLKRYVQKYSSKDINWWNPISDSLPIIYTKHVSIETHSPMHVCFITFKFHSFLKHTVASCEIYFTRVRITAIMMQNSHINMYELKFYNFIKINFKQLPPTEYNNI